MTWFDAVFTLIDMRSFSNLWFWIGLAVVWSTTAHFILGVPFDMVVRARRRGGQEAEDLEKLVYIHVRRRLRVVRVAGPWLVGFTSLILTSLLLLGFGYRVEFAQALFLIGFPLSLVGLMNIRTARRIEASGCTGPELYRVLGRHRMRIQALGLFSIFVTAMWGMWQNMTINVLGGA